MKATGEAAVVGRTVRGLGDLSNRLGDLSDQTVVVDVGLGLDLCPDHDPGRGRDPPVAEKGVTTSTTVTMVAGNKKKKEDVAYLGPHNNRDTHVAKVVKEQTGASHEER